MEKRGLEPTGEEKVMSRPHGDLFSGCNLPMDIEMLDLDKQGSMATPKEEESLVIEEHPRL